MKTETATISCRCVRVQFQRMRGTASAWHGRVLAAGAPSDSARSSTWLPFSSRTNTYACIDPLYGDGAVYMLLSPSSILLYYDTGSSNNARFPEIA
jgi:hypothetical protein